MASPPSGVDTPTSGGPSPSDLVERTGELGALASLIDEARHGGGRLALIEGPAGIGKTRLLVEARALADARGMRVLTARGSELEREFSFGVVRQLFEAALADPVEREIALAGAASGAAGVLGALGDDVPGAAPDASFAALHGLFWLALNMSAERPLMLAIDDLHWCDRPSLRFVAYLVRRLEDVPILVGATLRTGEQATDMALLAEITHDPSEVSVRPGPLSEAAVLELVRSRLGEDAHPTFCDACFSATGGNPLLLRQLLRALEADSVQPTAENAGVVIDIGPRAVSRTVLMRLARLPESAIAVSRAVAVLGASADLPAVSAMTGLAEADVAEATGALARSEILRPEHPLGFVHPLVRDAVYRELPAGERELYHARAAQVLQDAGWSAEQVAAQLLVTPRRGEDWVVATLQEAARFSETKGAPENAVAYLQRALEEPPSDERRPDIVFALGVAEALTDGRAAPEHLFEAYEMLPDAFRRAIAANVLARTVLFAGSPSDACAFIRRALNEIPRELRNERESLQAVEMISLYFAADDTSGLVALEPYRTAPIETTGGKMLAGMAAWQWANTGGSAEECVALARKAHEGGDLIAADNGLMSVPPLGVLALADTDDAVEAWEPALADAHRRGGIYAISAIHLWRGFALLRRGELVDAEESLRQALAEFSTWGHGPYADLYTTGHLAEALVARGDLAGARAALELADDMHDDSDGSSWWGHTLAEVLIGEGRFEEAIEVAEDLGVRMHRITNPAAAPWRTLKAQALARLGRWDEAVPLAEEELVHARIWGSPGSLGRGLRILGTLEREDGLAHLEEAVAVLTGSPARLQEAKALAAYGSALRRGRRPTDSREPLRRALELADICGAAGLVEHVRSELYASGSRPRTTAMTGVEALTASERRVVTMAAAGQTNRDVAQALFVTPKTVEVHLSSAYRKLGVRSRRELAGALAGADGA